MLAHKFYNKEYKDHVLNESILDIVSKTELLSLSTIGPDLKPHINTSFFSYDNHLNLYFISSPNTKHVLNLVSNSNVAATIFDSKLRFWEDDMQGLQIFGTCQKTQLLQLPKAMAAFIRRFPVFASLVSSPDDFTKKAVEVRMYTIKTTKIKLFDEKRFGEEVFIDLELC